MSPVRTRRALRLGVRVAVALVVGGAALEVGYRVLSRAQGAPYDAEATAREIRRRVHDINQPIPDGDDGGEVLRENAAAVASPYWGFEVPEHFERIPAQVARYRGHDPDETLVVLIVGGSLAGMMYGAGQERLVELLEQDARLGGREVEIVNHGRGANKQPQQLNLVAYLIAVGLEFDAVLNVDGFNEVALGRDNAGHGIEPLLPHWPRWAPLVGVGAGDEELARIEREIRATQESSLAIAQRALGWNAHHSAVLGRLVTRRLRGNRSRWTELQEAYRRRLRETEGSEPVAGPRFEADLEPALRYVARAWADCSRTLRGVCEAHDAAYLHVLQPTMFDPGARPRPLDEQSIGTAQEAWIEGVRVGYPHLHEQGRALADEGLPFLDAGGVFDGVTDPVYIDVCHLGERGNRVLAEAIAPLLADALASRIDSP